VPLPLTGATFGYLYRKTLEESLDALAGHGFRSVELTPVPPHLYTPGFGAFERRQLRARLSRLGLRCVSVNPSFADLNIISTNTEFRDLTFRQLVSTLQLAHDLGAEAIVVMPGRRHGLIPTPDDQALEVLVEQVGRLAIEGERLGVVVALENSPYGFVQTGAELANVLKDVAHPHAKVTFDVANALANEDPAAGLQAVAPHLALAHVSDTWREHWAHTRVGVGEVDFSAFAVALADVGFGGHTVYELVDGDDPDPRLGRDLELLQGWGWTLEGAGSPRPEAEGGGR
jgi:sugar phosphate isomerase/epimerase